MTVAPSPITNQPGATLSPPAVRVERAFVYRPTTDWTYSHHPHLTWFEGSFLAAFSNGRQHEDDTGQRVLISSSHDGLCWTPPRPLLDSRRGRHSEVVLTAAGFHQHCGHLVAYAGQYEYQPQVLDGGCRRPGDQGHQDTTLLALCSRDGSTWSAPLDLALPIVPNHGPQATRSGRLIISGNVMYPYSDAPDGLHGWQPTGIYPAEMAADVFDDSEGFWRVRERQDWSCGLCEGSYYQTDDGVLHMLLRSGSERLWVTESSDDGTTWSPPVPTEFTDNGTKFHFGSLPDGRYYYVGGPDPEPRGARCPLVLSLSEDGVHFTRHWRLADAGTPYTQQRPGLHKGGDYGYPHTLVHAGWLYAIVSRRKEAVEVLRVRLAEL